LLLNCEPRGRQAPASETGSTAPREAVLNILQKYLFREWLWAVLAVAAVLLVVMFGVTLGELLSDMAGGQIPPGFMGELLLLKLPAVINTILPIGVFVGIIWGLGRMYRDQEMAVMRASGFSWQMMLRPLLALLLPAALLAMVNGLFIAPGAAQTTQLRLEEAFRTASEWGLQAGQFHVLQNGDLVLYVEAVEKDGRTLRNIFIQKRQGGREQVWTSEKGYYWLDADSGERYLTLENGQITESGAGTLDFGIVHFSRNDLRLPEQKKVNQPLRVESRPSRELAFSRRAEEAAEVQWRISPALTIVVLGLLAIPLSHSAPREGRSTRILYGLLAYIVYVNVLQIGRAWIASDALPAVLGLWWVHGLALVLAAYWLRRQQGSAG
jgi:lipopolysaccharide export system permease protein